MLSRIGYGPDVPVSPRWPLEAKLLNDPQANPLPLFDLFNEIGIIHQLTTARLEAVLPDGLIAPHFAVLNHLARVGDGATPQRMARAFQVPKTSLTHTLKGLEARGPRGDAAQSGGWTVQDGVADRSRTRTARRGHRQTYGRGAGSRRAAGSRQVAGGKAGSKRVARSSGRGAGLTHTSQSSVFFTESRITFGRVAVTAAAGWFEHERGLRPSRECPAPCSGARACS